MTHLDGSRREVSLEALRNLGELDGLTAFAGLAVYRLTFNVPAVDAYPFLDLGVVREISEVTLNGRVLGARWYGRHLYALPNALHPGGNELQVRVTTVAGNYCKTLTANETVQKWAAQKPYRPTGLLGPVRLLWAK